MLNVTLIRMLHTFTSVLSAVCVQWPIWLYSVVPQFRALPVCYSGIVRLLLLLLLLCYCEDIIDSDYGKSVASSPHLNLSTKQTVLHVPKVREHGYHTIPYQVSYKVHPVVPLLVSSNRKFISFTALQNFKLIAQEYVI